MSSRAVLVVFLAVLLVVPAALSGAVVADEHGTPTPTPTPTETPSDSADSDNDSDDGDGSENSSESTSEARVAVTQSKYVSSAPDAEQNEAGRTVHKVNGRHIWLTPENFTPSEVTDVYISSESAQISYEQRTGRYYIQASEDGTYQVTFQVTRETVERDGNTSVTRTESKIYTTIVSVEGTDDSLASSEVQDNADRWDSYVQNIESIYGDNVDVVKQTNAGFEYHKFKSSPAQYALSSPISVLTILFIRPGGWMVLGLGILIFLIGSAGTFAYVRRNERTAGARRNISEMMDSIESEFIKQDLAGVDVHEAYADPSVGDTVRKALGDADSMWDALLYLVGVLDEWSLTKDRLKLMGATGYEYQATRDDDGNVTDVTVKEADEFNLNAKNLMDVDDDVVDWVFEESPSDHPVWKFNLREAPPVDFDTELRIENDVDSVLDQLAQMVRTPGKKRRRVQMFGELLNYVETHPHTDTSGNAKGLRWVVSGLTQLSDHISDKKSIRLVKVLSEHFYYLNNTTRNELEVDEDINAVQNGDIDPRDSDD